MRADYRYSVSPDSGSFYWNPQCYLPFFLVKFLTLITLNTAPFTSHKSQNSHLSKQIKKIHTCTQTKQLLTHCTIFSCRTFRCFLFIISALIFDVYKVCSLTQKPHKPTHLGVKNSHGNTMRRLQKGCVNSQELPLCPVFVGVCVCVFVCVYVLEEQGMSHAYVSCTVQRVRAKGSFSFSPSGKMCLRKHLNPCQSLTS